VLKKKTISFQNQTKSQHSKHTYCIYHNGHTNWKSDDAVDIWCGTINRTPTYVGNSISKLQIQVITYVF